MSAFLPLAVNSGQGAAVIAAAAMCDQCADIGGRIEVVAVGAGKKDEPMTVKEGDTVLYGKYSGTEITVDGKEYLIMREADIYAIV